VRDTPQVEKRMAITSCAIPMFAAKIQELASDDAKIGEMAEKGCSPLFLAVRFGKAVGMVKGANSPAIEALIKEQIPNIIEDEDE
jgi:hypothetical protein